MPDWQALCKGNSDRRRRPTCFRRKGHDQLRSKIAGCISCLNKPSTVLLSAVEPLCSNPKTTFLALPRPPTPSSSVGLAALAAICQEFGQVDTSSVLEC
eukprot:2115688-Pyramimonas_sp.AAC.2